ncbi:hypothetical protein [Natrarchaeobius halalkaliphilus]|nr:hypothetical protein [Natrarchaeobius halalkaliphilus]
MTRKRSGFDLSTRAVESAQSGVLLFGIAILLSIFMGAVILVNGA